MEKQVIEVGDRVRWECAGNWAEGVVTSVGADIIECLQDRGSSGQDGIEFICFEKNFTVLEKVSAAAPE